MSAAPASLPNAAPQSMRLPRLRQDLLLKAGPQHRDGSPSWRIDDPARNKFFEIGWLEFELLARWEENQTVDELLDQLVAETPLHASPEEVEGFIAFLIHQQLVVPEDRQVLARLRHTWMAAQRPWYEQLFHNYLFFRIPLVRPDRFLSRTLGFVAPFYTTTFAAVVALVFFADLYLVMRETDEVKRTFLYFFNLQGGIYFAIAATFSKIIHELAHAYTARRYGVRVPAMGVAFLVMWPFLYTDTGETWKLSDRGKQLAIAAAGIASELVLAVFATLLWTIAPDGTMKNVFFILATTTWVMTLAVNASPFMRFDGYFILSDLLDFPNLHERSSACARWWIRRQFFNLKEAVPEPSFTASHRRALVSFALVVWLYRLVVFFGIALLVYHKFYKPLGVVLFLLEIGWFIVMPVAKELRYLLGRIGMIRLAWESFALLFAAVVLFVWLVPIASQVTAPAVIVADSEQSIYVPFPAYIVSVGVRPRDRVEPGQIMVQLAAPELDLRERNAAIALRTARQAYLRGVATSASQERDRVLAEQVNEAIAEVQAVAEDKARLTIRAASSGIVRDMRPDIVAGRWINPRELMFRVVAPHAGLVEAYVSGAQVRSLEVGQTVKFVPDVPELPTRTGWVVSIDSSGMKQLPRPLLAEPFGGELPAVMDKRGQVTVRDPVYRVIIGTDAPDATGSVIRGTVRIETDFFLITENFVWRALSILIRESGI